MVMRLTAFGFTLLLLLLTPHVLFAGEQPMSPRSQAIRKVFNELSKETLQLVDEFYDEHASFEDPVGKIQGREGIKRYYAHMYENVTSIHFDFTQEVVQGNDHVVVWVMHMTTPNLNGGKEVVVHGNSFITFGANNQAIYHRDYFDMGEFIYERVP